MTERSTKEVNGLAIKLSAEEVFFMADQLGLGTLPMVNRETFDEQPESTRQLILDVARRGLIARSYFRPEDGENPFHPIIGAILATATDPQESLGIIVEQDNQDPTFVQFYAGIDVYMMQTMLPDRFVLFEIFNDRTVYLQAIEQTLATSPSSIQMDPIQVNDEEIDQLPAHFEKLKAVGISSDAVQEISSLFQDPNEVITLFARQSEKGEIRTRNLTLLKNESTAWLVEIMAKEDGDERFYQFTPFNLDLLGLINKN